MISCNLAGGLGNYLFQIAATYCVAVSNGDECMFDFQSSMRVHESIDAYKDNILRNIKVGKPALKVQYDEPTFAYDELPYQDGMLLNGYFQSEKYLDRSLILDLYSIDDVSKKYIYEKYGDEFDGAVSIHVRRGDYLQRSDRHPVQDMMYYENAMSHFDNCRKFFILSDDIEWCKDNFKGPQFIFVENNPDYIDLWIQSLCDHNIIANSSFSWWGAWLNKNPDKIVIAPKKWFGPNKRLDVKDLIPEQWITI